MGVAFGGMAKAVPFLSGGSMEEDGSFRSDGARDEAVPFRIEDALGEPVRRLSEGAIEGDEAFRL